MFPIILRASGRAVPIVGDTTNAVSQPMQRGLLLGMDHGSWGGAIGVTAPDNDSRNSTSDAMSEKLSPDSADTSGAKPSMLDSGMPRK